MLKRARSLSGRAACALACAVLSAGAAESPSTLQIKHEFFWDRNGVWNHTPAIALKLALAPFWSFLWDQEFDVVTGASRRLGEKVAPFGDPDAVSGASKVEVRHSESPGLAFAYKGFRAAGSLYYSSERDYHSFSPAGSASIDLFERNTTVGVSHAEFYDEFTPTAAFAGEGGSKRIRSTSATLAQSVTPLTLVGLTGNLILSNGYLGHPYNPPMDATGTIMTESLPSRRVGGAASFQIVQGWRGERLGSINLDLRRYQDDWGIKSITADMKISQYLTEGTYVRLRARYYNQSRALFAKDFYEGRETYRTGDVRFYPFTSVMVGAKLSFACPESWEEMAVLPDRWDVKFDYMLRDTRGDNPGASDEPRSTRYQLYGPEEQYMQGVVMVGMLFNL